MKPAWLPDSVTTDPTRMVRLALLWGIEALELRLVGRSRVPGINEAALKARLSEADLPVASIVPGLFEGSDRASALGDLSMLQESIDFARRFGGATVVVSGFSDSEFNGQSTLKAAADQAARHGLKIAVQNEPDMAVQDASDLLRVLGDSSHESLQAAWCLTPGAPATRETVAALAPRLALVRCQFASVADSFEQPLRLLAGAGWTGPVSFTVPAGAGRKAGLVIAGRLIKDLRKASRG